MATQVLDPTLHSPEVRDFEGALQEKVVGQDRAVRRLARVYQVYLAGLTAPGRPLVNLLLLGPTGSGRRAWWRRRPRSCLALPTPF
jgi:ATP-dependent Clp protease ATP-binding subunit ClpB